MKTVHTIITILIIAIVPITFISCYDPIPAGLETAVRGQVSDSVKQQRLSGAKVILWACHVNFVQGKVCYDIVDSVTTDRQGRFNMDFITAGNASEYQVSVYEGESFMNASREEIRPGVSNFISLTARELNHTAD